MDFVEQHQMTPRQVLEHWYYQAKFALLRRTLSSTGILSPESTLADLGCGVGVFLTLLEECGLLAPGQMIGIDVAAPTGQLSLKGHVPIVSSWPDRSFDFILLMDVLEHIENDQAALAQACGKLKPGGYLFITVPAFGFLWSQHDRVLGHHRRYSLSNLRSLIRTIPALKIRKLHYFYALIFPIAAVVRLLTKDGGGTASDLRPTTPLINGFLSGILMGEAALAKVNKMAGLSVVAFCQKEKTSPSPV